MGNQNLKLPMSADRYFDDHVPHRVNLLTSFRERYAPNGSRYEFPLDKYRDLSRCSKDISILMARFFCDEMGLFLDRKTDLLEERKPKFYCNVSNILQFKKDDAAKHPHSSSLLEVLRAANRAVAHIDENDVDHHLVLDRDNFMLFDSISWIEELIQSNMYKPNGRDLTSAMNRPNNRMS
jgi:hypothetical protein